MGIISYIRRHKWVFITLTILYLLVIVFGILCDLLLFFLIAGGIFYLFILGYCVSEGFLDDEPFIHPLPPPDLKSDNSYVNKYKFGYDDKLSETSSILDNDSIELSSFNYNPITDSYYGNHGEFDMNDEARKISEDMQQFHNTAPEADLSDHYYWEDIFDAETDGYLDKA